MARFVLGSLIVVAFFAALLMADWLVQAIYHGLRGLGL